MSDSNSIPAYYPASQVARSVPCQLKTFEKFLEETGREEPDASALHGATVINLWNPEIVVEVRRWMNRHRKPEAIK